MLLSTGVGLFKTSVSLHSLWYERFFPSTLQIVIYFPLLKGNLISSNNLLGIADRSQALSMVSVFFISSNYFRISHNLKQVLFALELTTNEVKC